MAPLQFSEVAAMKQATAVAVALLLLLPSCSAFCPRWSLAPGGNYAPKISRTVLYLSIYLFLINFITSS